MEPLGVYSIHMEGRVGLLETIEKLSPDGYFRQPMICQDGHEAVFWGRRVGETGFNIWSCDCGGGEPVKLTDMAAVSGHPCWSADGKHIVFFSTFGLSSETEWRLGNQFDLNRSPRNIWIMGADGEDLRKLTDGPHVDERPCISPDGKHVVFVSNRSGSMNLWSVSTDTGELEQFTQHEGLDYRPVFSPDGDSLAFFTSNTPTGNHDLCIMRWPHGEPSFPVPPGTFKWVHGPFWLTDGKSLLLHGQAAEDENCALWVHELQSKQTERIELPGIDSYAHGSLDASESILVFDSRHYLRR